MTDVDVYILDSGSGCGLAHRASNHKTQNASYSGVADCWYVIGPSRAWTAAAVDA